MTKTTAGRIVLGLLSVAYALMVLSRAPTDPIQAPDTAAYLGFSPAVPAGYPVFLQTLGPKGAMLAQPTLYACAIAWLGVETLALSGSLWVALAVWSGAIAIPDLTTYHFSLLTESLFMTLSIALLAAVVRFVRRPTEVIAILMAGICGCAAAVRAPGLGYVPVVPLSVWLQWNHLPRARRAWMLAAPLVVFIALAAAQRTVAVIVHRSDLTSLAGRALFAKASLIDAAATSPPDADPLRRRLDSILETRFEPVRRSVALASTDVRSVLLLFYETCMQGPCAADLGRGAWMPRWFNDLLLERALLRIERAPFAFVSLTMHEYRALWIPLRLHHPATSRDLNAFLESHRPLPFQHEALSLIPLDTQPREWLRIAQPIVALAGFTTGALMVLGVVMAAWRRTLSPALAAACLTATAAHGGLLITAMFAAGIGRYALTFWPLVMTSCSLLAFSLSGSLARIVARR